MKIYIAGSYNEKEVLKGLAEQLTSEGHAITSRWLWEPDANMEISDRLDRGETTEMDAETLGKIAMIDLQDIDDCDMMMLHTSPGRVRGGSATELGYAIAKGKVVAICRPRTQAFHFLPGIKTVCPSCGLGKPGNSEMCYRCKVMAECGS